MAVPDPEEAVSPRAVRIACVFSALVWVGAIVCLAGLFFAGCSSPDVVTIPRAPAWVMPQDARPITGAEVSAEIARLVPLARMAPLMDDTYSRVSRVWLDAYVTWTWEATKATGIRYTPESFDCENYAALFIEIARAKAAASGVRTAPLLAMLIVRADGTATHALVVVSTDRGVVVVEPQPDAGPFRVHPLAEYAGRIVSVRDL